MFEAPTVAQLARGSGTRAGASAVGGGAAPAVVPLSFAQSRLWFIEQLHGPSPVYNMAVALRLGGRLDAEALGAALADVVGRQESLRTLFPAPRGSRSSGWCRLSGPTSAGRSWMPPAGRQTGWRRPSARRRVARLTWPLRCRCGCGFPRRRRRARAGGRGAPYRRRWLVDHPAGAGSGVAYASRCAGQPRLGAVAGAVCRLHAVAAGAPG